MKRILLLGATSTIASDLARAYAAQGAQLYLVGRSPDKLNALCADLGDAVVGFDAMSFDDPTKNEEAVARAFAALGRVDLAFIAHGYLGDQRLSESEQEEAARIILSNYQSVVSLVIPIANRLEAQGAGHLAAISSVAGDRGRPRNYTYGSAKSAVTIYLQGVRSRLYPKVQVHTIKLGPVITPMSAEHEKNATFITSESAAQKIIRAIAQGKKEPYVPGFWRVIMAIVRGLPESIFQRLGFLSGR